MIGAGMGAMATAARLAVAGHRVTVYERSGTFGGAVGWYERDGFAFDTGPGLLHLPAVYRDLFVKTGKRSLEDCVDMAQANPAVRHVLPRHGIDVTLPEPRTAVSRPPSTAPSGSSGERWNGVLGR
ncbi:phytoene dehydrogenase, partial [Streptomyces sp. MBRL 10]